MTLQRQVGFWIGGLAVLALALYVLRGILLPFVAGLALAYFLDPFVSRLERLRVPRIVGALAVIDGPSPGRDELVGGAGNDTYFVDTPGDRVFEGTGQGTDRIVATSSYRLADGQEIEILQLAKGAGGTGWAPLSLTGNAFGQTLVGNAGDNRLDGGGGDDRLAGGLGDDRLTGGSGADTFVFDTRPGRGNVDHVSDFASPDDVFQLDHAVFARLDIGVLAPGQFKILGPAKAAQAAKTDADDRILYKQKTGELFYDADGSGRKEAVLIAVLDNHATLDHTDFLIV